MLSAVLAYLAVSPGVPPSCFRCWEESSCVAQDAADTFRASSLQDFILNQSAREELALRRGVWMIELVHVEGTGRLQDVRLKTAQFDGALEKWTHRAIIGSLDIEPELLMVKHPVANSVIDLGWELPITLISQWDGQRFLEVGLHRNAWSGNLHNKYQPDVRAGSLRLPLFPGYSRLSRRLQDDWQLEWTGPVDYELETLQGWLFTERGTGDRVDVHRYLTDPGRCDLVVYRQVSDVHGPPPELESGEDFHGSGGEHILIQDRVLDYQVVDGLDLAKTVYCTQTYADTEITATMGILPESQGEAFRVGSSWELPVEVRDPNGVAVAVLRDELGRDMIEVRHDSQDGSTTVVSLRQPPVPSDSDLSLSGDDIADSPFRVSDGSAAALAILLGLSAFALLCRRSRVWSRVTRVGQVEVGQ